MTIAAYGATNVTALIVPDVLVQILQPGVAYLNGVATNIFGAVGVASWGPTNAPVTVSDYQSYQRSFGALVARTFDMGTHVATAVLQGARNFRCVRVADGTQTAAAGTLSVGAQLTAAILFTGFWTGILGNQISITFQQGSALNSWRLVVQLPGTQSEIFDNITGAGAALWANIVAAVNTGAGQNRGPSKLIIASLIGTPTVAPVANVSTALTLAGGTDGAAGVTNATIVGVDGSPRTGCYALRQTGCATLDPCDMTDSTQFSVLASLCLQEGFYGVFAFPAGECSGGGGTGTVAADSAVAAIDTPWIKMLAGDWIYWNDPVAQSLRVVSPAGFIAGALCNLSPELSALNYELYGIAYTQTTASGRTYSNAELGVLATARMDVITTPSVGGNYYSSRTGVNASSNQVIKDDNYPRLTSYIARTLEAGMGPNVGKLQTPTQRLNAKAQCDAFFQRMWDAGMIGNAEGTIPFRTTLNKSNNPIESVSLGIETADLKVEYLSVIRNMVLNLQGGQSVQIVGAAAEQSAAA